MSTTRTETVGTKSAWEMWADGFKPANGRCEQLRKLGWFCTADFAERTGWKCGRARNYLRSSTLKRETVYDSKIMRNVTFYEPPPR